MEKILYTENMAKLCQNYKLQNVLKNLYGKMNDGGNTYLKKSSIIKLDPTCK